MQSPRTTRPLLERGLETGAWDTWLKDEEILYLIYFRGKSMVNSC